MRCFVGSQGTGFKSNMITLMVLFVASVLAGLTMRQFEDRKKGGNPLSAVFFLLAVFFGLAFLCTYSS
jgi:hypothetical protein